MSMVYRLQVYDSSHGTTWRTRLKTKEFPFVRAMCQDRTNMAGYIKAAIMPIRTHDIKSLAKDLFLPSLVNAALKVRNVVDKIFIIIFATIYDLLTFPLRIVTLIPRCIYNSCKASKKHILSEFLASKGAPQHLQEGKISIMLRRQQPDSTESNLYWIMELASVETPIFYYHEGTVRVTKGSQAEGPGSLNTILW